MSHRWYSLLCAALLGAFAAPLVAHEGHTHATLPAQGATVDGRHILVSAPAQKVLGLQTVAAAKQPLGRQLLANATVETPWDRRALVTTLVTGRVAKILVRPGDSVTVGQVLAELESPEVESLQLELLEARAQQQLAARIAQQRRDLAASGVVPDRERTQADVDLLQRQAAYHLARRKLLAVGLSAETIAQVEQSGQAILLLPLTSPLKGSVASVSLRVGELVDPTRHLLEVVDPRAVWVVGQVTEANVPHLAIGQPVTFTPTGASSQSFTGQIDAIGASLAANSWTLPVTVRLDNEQGLLRAGQFGRLQIEVAARPTALAIPTAAVFGSPDQPMLLVEEQRGVYLATAVTLGLRNATHVEVLKGLFPADRVVTQGGHQLAGLLTGPGQKATAVEGVATTAPVSAGPVAASPTIQAPATIELPIRAQAFAVSRVGGRLVELRVQPGQQVEAGQILAEIESLPLKRLQLELLQTLAGQRAVQQRLQRWHEVQAESLTARREQWQLQTELQTLQLRADSMRQQLQLAGLTEAAVAELARVDWSAESPSMPVVDRLPLRAPLAGQVDVADLAVGHVVSPDEPLVEIVDRRTVWVRAAIAAADASQVEVGQQATVKLPAAPVFSAIGSVVRISPVVDRVTRRLEVWIELPNGNGELRPGMQAQVVITTKRANPSQ